MAPGKPPLLGRGDSAVLVSARDASYWLAVASTPSSTRSTGPNSVSVGSSTRSLDPSSLLLSLRSDLGGSGSGSSGDGVAGDTTSSRRRGLLELRSHTILPVKKSSSQVTSPPAGGENEEDAYDDTTARPLTSPPAPPASLSSLYDSGLYVPTRLGVPRSSRSADKSGLDNLKSQSQSKSPQRPSSSASKAPAGSNMAQSMPVGPTSPSSTHLDLQRAKSKSKSKRKSKPSTVEAEEVFEYQRYQLVLGWGSKGHLLPLDPDKYMRVVRRPVPKHSRRPRSLHDDAEQDESPDQETLEWLPSATFPDIALPDPPASDPSEKHPASAVKQRSRSATSASRTWNHRHGGSSANPTVSSPRWEWVSPWHLELPSYASDEAADGWEYASSFSHFSPRPSFRSKSHSRVLTSQTSFTSDLQNASHSNSASDTSTRTSMSASNAAGKWMRVRRRKWVRYRRLRSGRNGSNSSSASPPLSSAPLTPGTSSSAFDDAFLDSMSGWLRKRGHVRKNWKARYFVLEKSTQVHYVDVHVAGGRDASFAVQVGPEYTLLLQASQLRDRENWMYCIEDALLCRDSYHPQGQEQGGPGPYFDLRESVAQRRLLSAEAMALDGGSFRENLVAISHAHGSDVFSDGNEDEEADDQRPRRSTTRRSGRRSGQHSGSRSASGSGSDVLRLWASLNAKPGGVLSAVSAASPTLRALLRLCDRFLATPTMRQHIGNFLAMFRQKYEHPAPGVAASYGASAWTRLSEPWVAVSTQLETDSDQELRDGSLDASPQELRNVTTLQDARSLLALKNYRFFLERSLELIVDHLACAADPDSQSALVDASATVGATRNSTFKKNPPTDDEWALARRAALYKLERRTFVPLQEVIYRLLGSGISGSTTQGQQRQEEEERFEKLRALVAAQPQSFLEIQPSHQSPSEWKSAIALLNSMDNYSLPSEKAAVLVEVARCIYETHAREHSGDGNGKYDEKQQPTPMAADDFLPIFIFVLARCRLRSVVVARHLISETMITALMIGETGYYATMLEAAIGYIAACDGAVMLNEQAERSSVSGSTVVSSPNCV